MLGVAGSSNDGARVAQLLEQLRRRAGEPPYTLPTLPTLPQPACEEELSRRARALGREPLPVSGPSGDSFLRVAAAQLPHVRDVDAYVREQRAAVAALVPLAAWAQPAPDGWALAMAHPDTAFDARALQLWSLLSDRGVLVLGADGDFASVCAVEGCLDSVTVLLDDAGRWIGVTQDPREGVQPVQPEEKSTFKYFSLELPAHLCSPTKKTREPRGPRRRTSRPRRVRAGVARCRGRCSVSCQKTWSALMSSFRGLSSA